jgi:hypothetical protein
MAGLVEEKGGYFFTIKTGKALLQDENRGELYALLFSTNLRTLDPGAMGRFPDLPEVQDTIAHSSCMIGKQADNWQKVENVVPKLLLSSVK